MTSPTGGNAARPPVFGMPACLSMARHFWSSFTSDLSSFHRLLGSLEVSWSLLGGSWRPLGASWGALGGVCGPLGPSWRRSKTTPKQHVKKEGFQERNRCERPNLKGGSWGAKIDPNRHPKRVEIQDDFQEGKHALQEPLGAILGRSWGILEAILESKIALRYWIS